MYDGITFLISNTENVCKEIEKLKIDELIELTGYKYRRKDNKKVKVISIYANDFFCPTYPKIV
jgi:hypothetical protein